MMTRSSQIAITLMGQLASGTSPDGPPLSSAEIAAAAGLRRPYAAKVLSTLSQAGLVAGTPGPGGGFRLARPPEEISLWDIVAVFERAEDLLACPLGIADCGRAKKCPLHDRIIGLRAALREFLRETRLDGFREEGGDLSVR